MKRHPGEETCRRCQQMRVVFDAKPEWGKVPSPLCSPCWSRYAEAREDNSYVNFNDAFDNADDDELGSWFRSEKQA